MKRILIIRYGALGDTLLLLPFLRSLEARDPGVELGLAGSRERLQWLAGQTRRGQFHEIDLLLSRLSDLEAEPDGEARAFFSAWDWIVHFTSAAGGGILGANLRRAGAALVSSVAALPPEGYARHAVFYPFDALGMASEHGQLSWRLNLGGFDVSARACGPRAPLALFPGAGSPAKRWPLSRWRVLLDAILERWERPLLWVLGPAEEEQEEYQSVGKEYATTGQLEILQSTPLRDLAARLSWAAAFIGSDCGVTHLASMLGLPTLALFGPSDPGRWGPLGERTAVLWGARLLRYPEWLQEAFRPLSTGLPATSPETILGWVREVIPES